MIITRSYFKGNIHIPNVEDTAPFSNTNGNYASIQDFINQYERDCLTKCLGYSLYKLFEVELDDTQPNGLKATADDKWNDLLNGKEYTVNGNQVRFKGLKFTEGTLERSLLAYYIFYHFLEDDVETYAGTGVQREQSNNAMHTTPIPKAVRAWQNFYKLTMGSLGHPKIITNAFSSTGVDYFGADNGERSLYQFINDMNNQTPDTYPNWRPYIFQNMNTLGI